MIASRSSATFLPEKSSGVREEAADAADAAASPALRAPFAAVCCRPRALPPAFAARLRAGVLADELAADRRLLDELLELDLRAVEADPDRALDLRADEADPDRALDLRADEADPDRALDFRAVEGDPDRALDLRAVDPELREVDADLRAAGFRAVEADDLRVEDPLERRPEEDALPPLPLFDSAMLSSSEASPTHRGSRTMSCPGRS
ncbi:MAG: hypothetical protein QOJ57_857 [Thermoleophilaceae bacterium]|nr:hypothetical protein [Thermoleophilaceae bacterium]